MQLEGKIKVINPTQEVSASFKKRELVITTDETYPQDILIEFNQAKCDDLNGYNIGDSVKVSINLRGRCWTNPQGEDKYFNTIQGWRIEKTQQSTSGNNTNDQPQTFEPATSFNEEEHDDLPW